MPLSECGQRGQLEWCTEQRGWAAAQAQGSHSRGAGVGGEKQSQQGRCEGGADGGGGLRALPSERVLGPMSQPLTSG